MTDFFIYRHNRDYVWAFLGSIRAFGFEAAIKQAMAQFSVYQDNGHDIHALEWPDHIRLSQIIKRRARQAKAS